MNLAEIIAADRASTGAEVRSRKRALQKLSELLADGAPYLTAGEIFSALVAREKLGSTGIGNGIAIPHARMQGTDETIGALIRLPEGVDFEADDGQPVDLIFGLLMPEQSDNAHSDIFDTLTQALDDTRCRNELRRAHNGRELINALVMHSRPAAGFHATL